MKLRFLVIGAWNTLFGLGVFNLLVTLNRGRLHYLVVTAVAQVIAVTAAYAAYKIFVFRTRGDIVREYFRFWSSQLALIGLQLALMWLFVSAAGLDLRLAQALTTVVSVAVSWLLHSRFSFRRNE